MNECKPLFDGHMGAGRNVAGTVQRSLSGQLTPQGIAGPVKTSMSSASLAAAAAAARAAAAAAAHAQAGQ